MDHTVTPGDAHAAATCQEVRANHAVSPGGAAATHSQVDCKLKTYKGVTISENKKEINKVRAGVSPGKALHDTLGKKRI